MSGDRLVVQKYGGTSVGDAERIKSVEEGCGADDDARAHLPAGERQTLDARGHCAGKRVPERRREALFVMGRTDSAATRKRSPFSNVTSSIPWRGA